MQPAAAAWAGDYCGGVMGRPLWPTIEAIHGDPRQDVGYRPSLCDLVPGSVRPNQQPSMRRPDRARAERRRCPRDTPRRHHLAGRLRKQTPGRATSTSSNGGPAPTRATPPEGRTLPTTSHPATPTRATCSTPTSATTGCATTRGTSRSFTATPPAAATRQLGTSS